MLPKGISDLDSSFIFVVFSANTLIKMNHTMCKGIKIEPEANVGLFVAFYFDLF